MKVNQMARIRIIKESPRNSEAEYNAALQSVEPIKLLKPGIDTRSSVLKALKERRTTRDISDKKVGLRLLSDLLWAACGVNRKKGPFGLPGRTAATASNSQEIDVFVCFQEGAYSYDALSHRLMPVVAIDLRPLAIGQGQSDFGRKAPVRLVYVADVLKLFNTAGYQEPGLLDPEIQKSYYFVDTSLIAANVYLFAASHGLAAWFHNCNKQALKEKLKLRVDQRVLFGQTIGYPVKK